MAYAVEISRAAQRQLRKLDDEVRRRIARRIDGLAVEPRPPGVTKLTGVTPAVYRIREGQYRVLFTIDDDELLVLVVRIGHRSDVYR
jgi:mRNA interferase RelE/StbE